MEYLKVPFLIQDDIVTTCFSTFVTLDHQTLEPPSYIVPIVIIIPIVLIIILFVNIGVHNYGLLVLCYLTTNAWLNVNVTTSFDNMVFVLEVDAFACNIINAPLFGIFVILGKHVCYI